MKAKEKPELRAFGRDADSKWSDVLELAKARGFVLMATEETALLATHKNQLDSYGLPEYQRIQMMNGNCAKLCGYDGCLQEDGVQKDCVGCCLLKKGA